MAYDVPGVVELDDDSDSGSEEVVDFGWKALRSAFIPSYFYTFIPRYRDTQELDRIDSERDQLFGLLEYRPRSTRATTERADSICVYEDMYR